MNKNSWYHSHSFKFCGLTWEFTYIEATASRTIQTKKADGTKRGEGLIVKLVSCGKDLLKSVSKIP
jgi:hypothetical protein